MDNWRDIWNKRKLPNKSSLLQSLIVADGFDSGAGEILEENWLRYVEWIITVLKIKVGDSIFEIGCGAGAFLYPFWKRGHKVMGVDRSETLIDIAKNVMSNASFSVCDANAISLDDKYDYVVSNGVFHYFPDVEYAEKVLSRMLQKALKKILISEIPSLASRDKSEKFRMGKLGSGEYKEKYKGLEHLYYSREWFDQMAEIYNCKIEIFDQNINDYGNNDFRFNVVLFKT